jgi:hypothetical protein
MPRLAYVVLFDAKIFSSTLKKRSSLLQRLGRIGSRIQSYDHNGYNGSAVKNYNAMSSLMCFENKTIFYKLKKTLWHTTMLAL